VVKIALNVGQLSQPVPGGIGRYVQSLVDGLPTVGVDVTAFGPHRQHTLVYERWHRIRWLPARNARAGVIHAPSLAVPPSSGRPLVVTVHDLVFDRFPATLTSRGVNFHRRGLAITRDEASAIIVPSQFVADELTTSGFVASRLHVIPHGVTVPPAPAHEELDALLASLNIRSPFVLAVGTVEPRKGLDLVAAAMQSVQSQVPDVTLVVAGAPGWGAIEDLDHARHRFLGRVSDVVLDALYRRATALAFASRYEGFGFPVLEALARGCPVVAGAIPSVVEVAGDSALLVAAGDADALAAAIVEVIAHDDVAADLAQRGRARAAHFAWDTSFRAHKEIYAALS
jgi:glycosyltransferase involved in cell wall biosynthesis